MKTTKAQFKEFQREFLGYVDALGLKEWDVKFEHTASDKYNAWVVTYNNGMKAEAGMSFDIDGGSPAEHAKHEAIELLLMPLRDLMMNFYSQEYVDAEIHKVLNRLMKVRLK